MRAASVWVLCVVAIVMVACSGPMACPGGIERRANGVCPVRCAQDPRLQCYADGAVIADAPELDAAGFDVPGAETGEASADVSCGAATSCAGQCVTLASDVANCGACGMACAMVSGARATCVAGACGFECLPGFERVGAGCDVIVPRQIAPISTSRLSQFRPTLRWVMPAAGVDGVVIEICRERACSTIVQTVSATGASATPTADLTPGVWFWRLRARAGTVTSSRTSPTWQFRVGRRDTGPMGSAGYDADLDGDGLTDVAAGAPLYLSERGAVAIYRGRVGGLSATPSWTLLGPDGPNADFGFDIENVGDVNGDGFGDIVVGAPKYSGEVGRAYLFAGSASGPSSVAMSVIDAPAGSTRFDAVQTAGIGDVNADGFADVAVSASGDPGGAFIFLGHADGLRGSPEINLANPVPGPNSFGWRISGWFDDDGDGVGDIAVSAPEGTGLSLYVFRGDGSTITRMSSRVLNAPSGAAGFGNAVVSNCDFNGDGHRDVIVGAGGLSAGVSGVVSVFLFHSGSIPPTPQLTIADPGTNSRFGFGAACGDTNDDGFDDVVVGAPEAFTNRGRVYVFLGSGTGVGTIPDVTIEAPAGTTSFGWAVGFAGDFDGDGIGDAISAQWGTLDGALYLFPGHSPALGVTPQSTAPTPFGRSGFGLSLGL